MRMPLAPLVGLGLALASSIALARDAEPIQWFNQAVQYDLSGSSAAPLAYSLFRRAADAGLPEAEFNVAVMLDSGRGVASDTTAAAIWYARAAAHGSQRAAYNLGQLYESGQGVPQNIDLARAWFDASKLAAGKARAVPEPSRVRAISTLSPPVPVAPAPEASLKADMGGVELVWTSGAQPEPVQFFVEVRALDPSGSREVFSSIATTSSLFAKLPDASGGYAWRVVSLAPQARRYQASDWSRFALRPDTN